ncbi:MAG: hypothetical protein ACK419_05760, partial [Pyrinomonadaceae bacterium]
FFPVKVGSTWTYKLSGEDGQAKEMTQTIVSVQQNSFTSRITISSPQSPVNVEGKVECSDKGIKFLDPTGFASIYTNNQDFQANFKIISNEGVSLPANLKEGDKWSQTIKAELVGGSMGKVKSPFKTTQATYLFNCTAQSKETVKVTAGTFDALKTICDLDIIMKLDSFEQKVRITNTSWMVSGVGNVKAVGAFKGMEPTFNMPKLPNVKLPTPEVKSFETETELVSYKIP